MSYTTLVYGESGTGKSTSLRNLDPESTFIISVLDKPLPFRGWRNKYSYDRKNFLVTDNYLKILEYIKAINERRPDIKTIILDDFQYLMANEFMRRSSEKSFDKFTEIGNHAWLVICALMSTKNDLQCFVMCHSAQDVTGKNKIKTIGKMLDEKVTLEGMFTVVLYSKIVDYEYVFLTQNDGESLAKSPMGMFADLHINNDLQVVIDAIKQYEHDDNYEEI